VIRTTAQTWEAIFFDERSAICIGVDGSWRARDDGNPYFHCYFGDKRIYAQEGENPISPRVRALVLSPRPSITSGEGPTNARPACSTFLANPAFSERKPYLKYTRRSIPCSDPNKEDSADRTQDVSYLHHVLEQF
jgi:hypothetical protein